ncbi:MAG: esterase-like activity of phytase family protein [Pseudomonadota bacterium]
MVAVLAACVGGKVELPPAPVAYGPAIEVEADAVSLDPRDPEFVALGDFRYAGGIAVSSRATSRLHGLSDLVVSPGGRITAVSDEGDLITARLVFDGERLSGVDDVAIRPLRGEDGKPLQGKQQGDAEGLAILQNGEMLVSFEQTHRIWRFPPSGDRRPFPVAWPKTDMSGHDNNDGMEGLAAAPTIVGDGYWVGIEPGGIWFCRLNLLCDEVAGLPTPPPGFRLSSLTVGPDGSLVVLHHNYTPGIGSRIRVTIVRDPKGAKRTIGHFTMGPGPTTDNFEGIAVVKKPNDDWRIYLLSDDNFSPSQRTLLLAFDWTPPR